MSVSISLDPVASVSLLGPAPGATGGAALDVQTLHDLALDQVVARLERGRGEYALGVAYTQLLTDEADVRYRHDVFRELDGTSLRRAWATFCERMVAVRRQLPGERMRYELERDRWFLDAAAAYADAVRQLAEALNDAEPRSEGLRAARAFLRGYVSSSWFRGLDQEAAHLLEELAGVTYRLRLAPGLVEVSRVRNDEVDYVRDVEETFARFRREPASSYRQALPSAGGMDHVQAAIATFVARLYPEVFTELHEFAVRFADLVDPQLRQLERDAQFYLAYLEVMDELRSTGVEFCYPTIDPFAEMSIERGRDIALGLSLYRSGGAPVPNTCAPSPDERVMVITGPNQGGKTTFARTVGQIHALAALGLPVPARSARVPLVDTIATIFERGEDLDDLHGHLYDDLLRTRRMLDSVGPRSLVVLNELFSSTAWQDAVFLGTMVIDSLVQRGSRAVFVTFLDELSRRPGTMSLVAAVDPRDPTRRTFEVVPHAADGRAYAQALADRYALSRRALGRRLAR